MICCGLSQSSVYCNYAIITNCISSNMQERRQRGVAILDVLWAVVQSD